MNYISKRQPILFCSLVEIFFIVWQFRWPPDFSEQWISLMYIGKILLGIILYMLFIKPIPKILVSGPLFITLLIIAIYVIYYTNPELSNIVGGYYPIILATNTLFIFRYLKHPNMLTYLDELPEKQSKPFKSGRILSWFYLLYAFFGLLSNTISGWTQLGVALFWISSIVIFEGLLTRKSQTTTAAE